jgi:outer membrane immunogenic protein
MRKLVLSIATVAGFAGHAFAADLPTRKEPPPFLEPSSVFSWSGFYVGVQGGGEWGRASGLWGDAAQKGLSPYANSPSGGLIGGHAGYNWQIGKMVLGIEGDANAALGVSGATSTVYNSLGLNGNPVGTTLYPIRARQVSNEDIRLRLGYAIDRTLLYLAGGAAFGDVKTTYYTSAPSTPYLTVSTQRVGWTLGGGLEYAFTDSILGRVEYRYTDLGSKSFSISGGGGGNYDNIGFHSSAVLVGLTYKFGATSPVVAAF